jgi:capsular polysaccharide transport system ATP-binding protein
MQRNDGSGPYGSFNQSKGSKNVIHASDLVKIYPSARGPRRVLDGLSFTVARGEKLAVLGRNGAGKSTLVRILAGIEQPSTGQVVRQMSMSWPLGLAGGFSGSMTGYDCGRFVSRLYGREWRPICDFLEEFSELGRYMAMPIKTYSTGMRARLAFGISLAIDFDCYLIDEIVSVGDKRFQRKSFDELFGRRKNNAMIIVSHNFEILLGGAGAQGWPRARFLRQAESIRYLCDVVAPHALHNIIDESKRINSSAPAEISL